MGAGPWYEKEAKRAEQKAGYNKGYRAGLKRALKIAHDAAVFGNSLEAKSARGVEKELERILSPNKKAESKPKKKAKKVNKRRVLCKTWPNCSCVVRGTMQDCETKWGQM